MRKPAYQRDVRTRTDRQMDLVHFLAMARPEKVAAETPETLAVKYGVKLAVARDCWTRAGYLL